MAVILIRKKKGAISRGKKMDIWGFKVLNLGDGKYDILWDKFMNKYVYEKNSKD